MNNNLFEVSREDYKAFVERLIPGAGEVRNETLSRYSTACKIYSKATGKCWCSRVKVEDEDEKYYIFEYPEDDEWGPPIPKMQIVLDNREDVQTILNYFSDLAKENKND